MKPLPHRPIPKFVPAKEGQEGSVSTDRPVDARVLSLGETTKVVCVNIKQCLRRKKLARSCKFTEEILEQYNVKTYNRSDLSKACSSQIMNDGK